MRYTLDETLQETLRRAGEVKQRRYRLRTGLLSGGAMALAAAILSAAVSLAPQSSVCMGETAYGAFLLPGEAGGFILAGVCAFVLGVLVTLLCLRLRGSVGMETGKGEAGPGTDALQREEKQNTSDQDAEESEGEIR